MNQTKFLAVAGLALIALLIMSGTVYTIDEREKAVVVRFGQVIRYDDAPGIHVKTPFLETVKVYDARILTMDADPQPFLTKEKKSVIVDSYVKWRIVDLLKYYVSVGGDEQKAKDRLAQLINSGLRDEFGKRNLRDVVSGDRRKIMEILSANTDKEAGEYGIEVVDVRIQRVDLPAEVSQSVYRRMEAERARIAKELRAQGAEEAEKIRANAERQREVLLAEAYRDAERLRGEGDARATATYGRAFGANPEFYSLYRSLNAYKESFKDKDDILIVDPSADFFRYFKNPRR
ncbi:MAG: protease modulator HflC [Candidatus Muproteobacteria bacterium RBG_16_64_11]|uniref:Protein HflC n=1 Tax=Candidatus Muproteobacteria bacterium RBG_16_64_11 TaxID=1817758 RepID=A0A1F6T9F7_9PROT|nr:MAG: protease modulator HflC [Candidatus Muproteobacteria bacterium RBG_16_64_11]